MNSYILMQVKAADLGCSVRGNLRAQGEEERHGIYISREDLSVCLGSEILEK